MTMLELAAQAARGKGASNKAVDAAESKYLAVMAEIVRYRRGKVD